MMRYSSMRGGAQYRVEIPQLSGGVNLTDLPTRVEDNQLISLSNMWWHQGVLRTRPGLQRVRHFGDPPTLMCRQQINDHEIVIVSESGNAYSVDATQAEGSLRRLGFIDDEFLKAAPQVLVVKDGTDDEDNDVLPYLFFASTGNIYRGDGDKVTAMTEEHPYVPWVTVEKRSAGGEPQNVSYESFNMLTGDFRSSFSTDGERTVFKMPLDNLTKASVTVKITLCNHADKLADMTIRTVECALKPSTEENYAVGKIGGLKKRELFPDAENDSEDDTTTYDIGCTFDWETGTLTAEARTTKGLYEASYPLPVVTSNNIEVTARKTKEGQKETIGGMTKCVWFGGTRSGIGGGTRLFVTGNSRRPNLVHYSDVNNPLYFPENNYFYVGDADQAITAFGKQGDLLVIFKEHEIFCTQYVAGSSFTSEDLISGKVTDISALAAQFPLTPIHPTIGCDCPDTIRLVNNRLVWATSDAHVYMMPSVNQYSERNVRDITACIRRRLEQHTAEDLKKAMATEYKGHYMLLLPDGTVYLLDVGNSAFQSFAYYASEKKANRALPWYIWTLGGTMTNPLAVASSGDEMFLLLDGKDENGIDASYLFNFGGYNDDGKPIACSFTTKLFDFGRGDKLKSVREMIFRVGCAPNSCVRLSYMTEDATFEDVYRIEPTEESDVYDAGYIRSYRVTPNVNRARLFGLRCDSEGAMAVEGVGMTYSLQGVIR